MSRIAEDISPEFVGLMSAVAQTLDTVFNPNLAAEERQIGWALWVFEAGSSPSRGINYMANVEREEMVVALDRWLEIVKAERTGQMN